MTGTSLRSFGYSLALITCLLVLAWSSSASAQTVDVPDGGPRFRALVFSGTAGFRHESISAGIDAVRDLGISNEFYVHATEQPSVFQADSLAEYDVVVFLNTSGDILNGAQQSAFENYIQGGGGFAGIHGAAATEYDWEWYGELVGAFFDNHPEPQSGTVEVLDRAHPSTRSLSPRWERFDEWYNFRTNPGGVVHVLAVLEESSYEGGEMEHDHPIAWAHAYDGGRAWYTGLGHTVEGFDEAEFRAHLLGGIEWAAGVESGDASATVTAHFEKVILMSDVTDPVEMGIDGRGRVFVGERSGPIKMWDPETEQTEMVGFVPVRMTIEDGLLGLTLDPKFEENGWMYVYYAPADGGPQRLARWTFDGERLDPGTEKILLEIHTQQKECCHSGGSLTFGPEGNLFLSTGDNTNPYPLGGSPIDERPGFREGDAQRSSANTNDLRGKIIRIRPLPDGTYAIPEGNLFEGDSLHRPEIYTMGHRNPYRISVDAATGWLYWGDVGIGNAPSEARGPWGWEEFNQARAAGFYGWPYFVGPNDAYRDFDYVNEVAGAFFDPDAPVNESPNNTGARELPPAQPAMIWYTYGPTDAFPDLGSGGMSAMGGPVYRYDAGSASPQALPEYYDGSFLIYEWMRNWVKEVKFDADGHVLEINPFLTGMEFERPGDMEIGPDGRLYVIEWGDTFWGSNPDAQVIRVDYHDPVRDGWSRGEVASREGINTAAGFVWPPNGGIFTYDEPIAYEVSTTGSGDARADVVVRAFSAHDTHEHPLEPVRGSRGEVVISRAFTHVPDLHYVDRYGVLEASHVDEDTPMADSPMGRVVLRPRIVEAEHSSDYEGAERETVGKHPAEPDFASAALTVMRVQSGGYLSYSPLNLTGIDTLVLRVKPVPGGTIEVRSNSLEGAVIAKVDVDSLSGHPAGDASGEHHTPGALHGDLLPELPEGVRSAYLGWRSVHIPVSHVRATEKLYLSVTNPSSAGEVLRIDHLEFIGPGVLERPE